jgi:hypothetical protein
MRKHTSVLLSLFACFLPFPESSEQEKKKLTVASRAAGYRKAKKSLHGTFLEHERRERFSSLRNSRRKGVELLGPSFSVKPHRQGDLRQAHLHTSPLLFTISARFFFRLGVCLIIRCIGPPTEGNRPTQMTHKQINYAHARRSTKICRASLPA